ncbi:PRD domain-containing protein [Microbacterium sp.]|uniref:PRD domain-containing protein n=1 Tax=Microbacterium sp. TaxID=51671 RepID=UPI003C706702
MSGGPPPLTTVRAFNNNIVVAVDAAGREYILMGKGIGFGASAHRPVDRARVDRIFLPQEGEATDRIVALLSELSPDILGVAHDASRLIAKRLRGDVHDSLVVALADHLAEALKRTRNGDDLTIPLTAEVLYSFPTEVTIARDVLRLVEARTGTRLPDQEAAAIALHVINARFQSTDMSTTFQLTTVLNDLLNEVEQSLGVHVDPASVDVARFATHLRFLLVRLQNDRPHTDTSDFLWDAARSAHPLEHTCALRVGQRIADVTGSELTREEELYLTLHVLRLTAKR